MTLREREMPLDPEIERELEAIDRVLSGEPVDPDLGELAQLAVELRSTRPAPGAEVDARLDELAAAGFPPRASDRLGRLSRRASNAFRPLREKGARRLVPALGAATVFLVVIGVGISQSGVFGGNEGQPTTLRERVQSERPLGAPAPSEVTPSGSTASRAGVPESANGTRQTFLGRAADAATVPPARRQIAQRVDLELSTSPDDFRDAADGVLDVVRDHRGFVVRSSVSGGDPGVSGAQRGRASFKLRIPAGELSTAMGDLSSLGHVVSRTDGTLDITKRFVSARKRIAALTAARDRLLQKLGEATTLYERQSIRARLRIVRAQLTAAEDDLAKAQQRVHLVPVSVAITADAAAVDEGGSWSIGDAFHDAGRILTVSAGVALVSGAAALPFALLLALGAAGRREWVRRQRNRALDAPAA